MGVRVFVGNVADDATEADLQEHFGKFNPSRYWYVPYTCRSWHGRCFDGGCAGRQGVAREWPNRNSNLSRIARKPPGFAFIEFDDSRDADDAVRKLDG